MHEVLKVSYCDRAMSVIWRRQFALEAYSSSTLVESIRVTCKSKMAKIVLVRNPRWPPSCKSILHFCLADMVGNIWMTCRSKYSQTSIIRSARDCRNFFELSVVRISEIGSFRICSDFFIQYRWSDGNICLSIKNNELLEGLRTEPENKKRKHELTVLFTAIYNNENEG